MKKHPLYVAGLALGLASPLVSAADAAPSVQLYGRLHVSVGQYDNGDDSETNVTSNASRLGVKGQQDLGQVTAIYQIESDINADKGNTQLATRNTFFGLKGGFGTVRIGRFDSPVKDINSGIDLFADALGDLDNISRRAYGRDFDNRENNAIGYTSPSFGGFTVNLQYATNIDNANANNPDTDNEAIAASVAYKQGPVFVALGYQRFGEDTGNGDDSPSLVRLGGSYDLGSLRLIGFVQQGWDDPRLEDSRAYGVGARYGFGDFAIKAQYVAVDPDADDRGAQQIALGGEYKLAKNLTTYLVAAYVDNDDASALIPWRETSDGDFAGVAGEKAYGAAIGAIYNF